MSQTKASILENSRQLFNRFGYVNIRLQHIADEVGISVGNLAYHFKNKDAILEAIYQTIEQEHKQLLAELRIVPLFANMDAHIRNTFHLQGKYSFFYMDLLEILRADPVIKRNFRKYSEWLQAQIGIMLDFNVARGALRAVPVEGQYALLAQQFAMLSTLWRYHHRVRGHEQPEEADYVAMVWGLLVPYFTDQGILEFKQMNALGNYNWM